MENLCYKMSQHNFDKIPGSPIAYWVSSSIYDAFEKSNGICGDTKKGVLTGDNNTYLRFWHEVENFKIGLGLASHEEMIHSKKKWFPVTSGGNKRRWYGNIDTVVNLENDGRDIKENVKNFRLREPKYYFRESISWTEVCSGVFSCRYIPEGILFGNGGPSCFFENDKLKYTLGLLNTNVVQEMMKYLAPTLNYGPDQISKVPVLFGREEYVVSKVNDNIAMSVKDWDGFETSLDFKKHPLI